MAELIHMRQRIKTVETIQKITHAMRLVSMSAHAQLGKQYHAIQQYHAAVTTILRQLQVHFPEQLYTPFFPSQLQKPQLLIIIGSEKGLCGSFNSTLFYALSDYLSSRSTMPVLIPIGKKATDFVQATYGSYCMATFPHLAPSTVGAIAQALTERSYAGPVQYATITVLSNAMKSFFIQTPRLTPILPLQPSSAENTALAADYIWDVDPHELIASVTRQYITSTFHTLLLESLYAEHAARFVSMDSSTRNAERILEDTRLKYNKLRQAKITKEILELADTF